MSTHVAEFPPLGSLTYLSRLLLRPASGSLPFAPMPDAPTVISSRDQFDDTLALAHLNHVVVRWLEMFVNTARKQRNLDWFQLADSALSSEKSRIAAALNVLHEVCAAFQHRGYAVMVIKTLDHWPDFGSDMDLFTNAQPHEVSRLMAECFNARIAPRSWGDYLANCCLPGSACLANRRRWLSIQRSIYSRSADDLHVAAHVSAFQYSPLRHH
jgi:hypothetical protein